MGRLLSILLAIVAISCGNEITQEFSEDQTGSSVVTPPGGQSQTDAKTLTFKQPLASSGTPLDLLIVLDTSGSLDKEMGAVFASIEEFMSSLPPTNDTRIAMMLGHVGSWSGRLYQNGSEPLVIPRSTHTPKEIQSILKLKAKAAPLEAISDGGEAGMFSLLQSLGTSQKSDLFAAGFYRDEAALAVMFISDENAICSRYLPGISFVPDVSGTEVQAYNTYCLNSAGAPYVTHTLLAEQLSDLKSVHPIFMGGTLYTGANANPVAAKENEIGHGYLDLIKAMSGSAIDLQDPKPDNKPQEPKQKRIAEELQAWGSKISLGVKALIASIQLEPGVVIDSITVTIDGQASNSFSFNSASNTLQLTVTGQPGSTIEIHYEVLLEGTSL